MRSALARSLVALALVAAPALAYDVGARVEPFEARDAQGARHALADLLERRRTVVLVVWSSSCPHSKAYGPRLERLRQRFSERVTFLGVAPGGHETPATVLAGMREHGVGFPILMDPKGPIARKLGAQTTPTAYVIDAGGHLRYRGAIDDDPLGNEPGRTDHLARAIDAVLAGRRPPQERTGGPGFRIRY